MKSINIQRVFHHLHFIFLPLILSLLFAVQNQVFNKWLNLSLQYSGRLLFASFALGLILYSPSLFFKKKGRYGYLFLISFLISLTFIAQFLFFQYGQSFLQVSALKYVGQAFSVLGTVKDFISFKLFVFVINIFVVGTAFFLTFKKEYQPVFAKGYGALGHSLSSAGAATQIILSKKEKTFLFLLLITIAFFGYYFLVREEKKEWGNSSRLYKDIYDLNTLVEKIGIVNFTLEDTFKSIARSNLVTLQDKNFLKNFAKNKTVGEIKKPAYFGIDKGKNVIFIQIESLENAVINQKIDGQEITPNLNKLAGEGLYFSNYYTQVGPGNTADAEFSTLNSLYPLQDDVVFTNYAQNNFNALPRLLAENGYHTYALHGDVPTFWNRSNAYPNLGYQEQISEGDYVMTQRVGHGPSPLGDEDFLTQSVPKMEGFKQPFLSTLITLSSHTPFELPKDLQTLQIPQDANLNYEQRQYLESLHYMDMALGKFIDTLKQENFYKNSVIFMYGDHQSFTNISSAFGVGDKNLPALSLSQVPLLILNSGILPAEIKTPASHLDLYPTILNLLGFKPLQSVLGQDIFNTKNPVVTRRNIFSGTINTILTDKLAFKANTNGVFEYGTCLKMPDETSLSVSDCQNVYNQQADTIKASDIIIRGNLLDILTR